MPEPTQRRADLPRATRVAALIHHLDRHRRALDVRATLGTADLRLLWLLADGEFRSLRQVAEALHLEQSTVNRQVNAAVQAGLLQRSRPAPAAPYVFAPTPLGRATFERETARALALYQDVLDRLGPEDGDELLRLLGQFVDLYGEAVEQRDVPRMR